ncbi:MAG TPA: hypothetical protein VGB90_07685 [Alphaproteobacteria bacterium]
MAPPAAHGAGEARDGKTSPTVKIGTVLAMVALGLALRVWEMDAYVLDGDEIFSLEAARRGWGGLIETVAHDVSFPPLYYLLLKLWILVGGDGLAWTRFLSALLGAAALAAAAPVCERLGLRFRETLLVLFLLAVNAFLIDYSQHLRAFVLLQLTSTLALLAFLDFLAAPPESAGRAAVWLTVANIALVYSHYWGWLILAGQGLYVVIVARRRFWAFIWTGAAAFVAFLPWVAAIITAYLAHGSLTSQISWIDAPTPFGAVWFIAIMNGVLDIPRSATVGLVVFGIPALAWALIALRRLRRSDGADARVLLLLVVMAGMVPVATYLGSIVPGGTPVFGTRHLTATPLPYYALVALAVWRVPAPRLAPALASLIALWAALASYQWRVGDPINFPKKFRTEQTVAHVRANDPTSDARIVVYGIEGFTTKGLQFHANEIAGRPFDVRREAELAAIGGDHFWFTYRQRTWREPTTAEVYFGAKGYAVSARLADRLGEDTVIIFFARR